MHELVIEMQSLVLGYQHNAFFVDLASTVISGVLLLMLFAALLIRSVFVLEVVVTWCHKETA